MNTYSGWIVSTAGIALITIVPLLVVKHMRRQRSGVAYAIWFTAGSSAAGYSLLVAGAVLDDKVGDTMGVKLLFGVTWWLYLGIVSETIATSWAKIPNEVQRP